MFTNPQLTRAVHLTLISTGAAASAAYTPDVLAQDEELEQVVVTGSRIRRVEGETASPVFTLDRSSIEASGTVTMGQLVQQVPAISGAATNPSVNNGGGTGASTIELRGLGSERTLVLLNGRRIGAISSVGAVDVNMIPVNLVERVEVLKEGAGAIYGSDAIGGVVNFITREDLDGIEVGYDYGVSDRGDGKRHNFDVAWGTSGERGGIILAANYNQMDEISAGDRKFSRDALYLYGSVFAGGSSRAPNGRISLPAPLRPPSGCSSVTRIEGTAGATPGDYRCFVTSGDNADFYNYQPLNLIITPQERGSFFTSAHYDATDNIEVYAELLANYTTSGFKIAPLPFDSRSDGIVIPANNVYNPFGIAFGGGPQADGSLNPNALWRLEALGQRRSKSDTSQNSFTVGVRGDLFGSSWKYDTSGSYGAVDTNTKTSGYLFKPAVSAALGPNFIAADGTVTCGTPTAPIANCTPVNIFNLDDPAQVAALKQISADYNTNYSYTSKMFGLDFTGDLFKLPAGMVQAAVGYGYNKQESESDTDTLTTAAPPLFKDCQLAGETCSGDARGSYYVNEFYGEIFVPLLADLPGAKALNLTVGGRYSDYSTFGDTTNGTYKLEWRPISDLLIRASYADVFRAPQIYDLFGAPTADAAQLNDICVGLTAAQVVANPNLALACENVPLDGTFEQPNSQVDGLIVGNTALAPETGTVFTYGLVYEPSWASGLSINVDFWDYEIDDTLTAIDVNTTVEQCAATGSAFFCDLINRYSDGTIQQIQEPVVNLGKLETSGVDFGVKYLLRDTAIGGFNFSLDMTYIDKYDNTPQPGVDPVEVAGTYNRQYGNYAEWRGLGSIGWSMDMLSAVLTARYVGDLEVIDPDGAAGVQEALQVDAITYLDFTFTAKVFENVTLTLGVDNLTNEQPPIMYQNNVLSANTDVRTYDTVGTFWRGGVTFKF